VYVFVQLCLVYKPEKLVGQRPQLAVAPLKKQGVGVLHAVVTVTFANVPRTIEFENMIGNFLTSSANFLSSSN
jgi:hypothetical protein